MWRILPFIYYIIAFDPREGTENSLDKILRGNEDRRRSARRSTTLKAPMNGFKVTRPDEEVPTDPKEDNALPNQNINNYYLGNVLHSIF